MPLLHSQLANAGFSGTGTLIEEPKIVAVGNEGEIRIRFSQEVRYLRHFPESQGDTLRIFLEVADPCTAEQIVTQESRWLPLSDWYSPFTITFPEIIKRSGTGTAVCSATHAKVDVAQTLLVKFGKFTKYEVRRGNDNRSLIVTVPLIKNPNETKMAVESKPAEASPAAKIAAVSAEPSKNISTTTAPAADKAGTAPVANASPSAQKASEAVKAVAEIKQDTAPAPEQKPSPAKQDSAATVQTAMPDPAQAKEPPAEEPVAPKPPPFMPNATAAELMTAGREALAANDGIKATLIFNQLLDLLPNEFSKEGQELVGLARQMSGEYEKAKVEYQLYLKLYPDGEGADRVKQHLAEVESILATPKPVKVAEKSKKARREIHQNTFTGSLSQYYYSGSTQNRVKSDTAPDTYTRSHDQATLITNVDATERMRHNEHEAKIVFRNTETHNFLSDIADKNTLSAAYVEYANKDIDYMFRIGRQSGTSQGVMGRFDGAFGRIAINPQWHLTAVVGQPDDGSRNTVRTDRSFYGAAVEFGPLAEKWSGSVYLIQQIADGMVERRAIGNELRYFNGTTSWFGTIDYDTTYNMVNVAMVQGNWVAFDGYNFNLLLDHRKSPMLYGEVGIQGKTGARSVGDLRSTLSNDDVRDYVKGLVPDTDMIMLGLTKQVSSRWQLGGDIRFNRTYNTDGAGDMTGQPGSGNIYNYTVQAIGNSILTKEDTLSIMGSYTNDPHFNAQNLSLAHSFSLHDKWRLDSGLGLYHERQSTDVTTWKVTPRLRVNYRWRDNMSFEAEATIDRTHTDDPVSNQITDNWRETLFAGYRWDFR